MSNAIKGQAALDALWDALGNDRKPPPPNSISAYDYKDKFKVTAAAARCRLDRMVGTKELQCGKFWCEQRKRAVIYYWQVTK